MPVFFIGEPTQPFLARTAGLCAALSTWSLSPLLGGKRFKACSFLAVQQEMPVFDNILKTIGRTPVVRINKLAPAHVEMYVKVEAFNPMSSVKDRLAIAIIEDAERRGALKVCFCGFLSSCLHEHQVTTPFGHGAS